MEQEDIEEDEDPLDEVDDVEEQLEDKDEMEEVEDESVFVKFCLSAM